MWNEDDTVICIGELWDQGTVALLLNLEAIDSVHFIGKEEENKCLRLKK